MIHCSLKSIYYVWMFEKLELNKRERMHKEMREKGTQNITT